MNKFRKLFWTFRLYSCLHKLQFEVGDEPMCYIFLAADYGNLGDVAITYAQKKFLKENFPNHEVIEVPAAGTLRYLKSIKRQIQHQDIVTVVGGGNMGDMYGDIELLRLLVVKTFSKNRVILFPQTIDYSDSQDARWLKRLSQKIYSSASQLTMCARERVSYDAMRQLYPDVDVRLTPDIVMSLDERRQDEDREDVVTFCLRHDKEKADNDELISRLLGDCQEAGLKVEYYDTHIGGDRYSEEEKYGELEKIWTHFRRSRLVVTDRLHGMIFAFITGTPAIVLPNSNFKVAGCYQWIKDCGYIQFVDGAKSDLDITQVITAPHNPDVEAQITELLKAIL